MSTQINMAASQGPAVSIIPSELVAVKAILDVPVDKPQRLRRIFASLCYLLAYNTDPQDYYFTVDPLDRPSLAGRGLEKFERLVNMSTDSALQLHFIPETGKMTALNMSTSLRKTLNCEVYYFVRRNIARVPVLTRCFELIEAQQHIITIAYNNKPYAVFLLANPGNSKETDDFVRSILPDVTRNYPSLRLVVLLQLRGLDRTIRYDNNDIEKRVGRISQKSSIQVWCRKATQFNKDDVLSAEGLPEDGEFRLPLFSKDTEGQTAPVLQFSDILQVIREYCQAGHPLSGHPDNKDSHGPNTDIKRLRASVFPLDALKSGFAAGIAQLLAPRPRGQVHKAGGAGSRAPFSSLSQSRGAALATRRGTPQLATAGLGPIKADGSARCIPSTRGIHNTCRIHSTTGNTAARLLSVRHLVGRLLRR